MVAPCFLLPFFFSLFLFTVPVAPCVCQASIAARHEVSSQHLEALLSHRRELEVRMSRRPPWRVAPTPVVCAVERHCVAVVVAHVCDSVHGLGRGSKRVALDNNNIA